MVSSASLETMRAFKLVMLSGKTRKHGTPGLSANLLLARRLRELHAWIELKCPAWGILQF
jgi:hypothetical protein